MNSSKSSSIIHYTLFGALAFFIAGIIEGFVVLRYEAIISFPLEGVIGGLLFGLGIAKHVKVIRTTLASLVAIIVGLFWGAFLGLVIYDGYQIPFIISGLLVGGLFGLIIGANKHFLQFAVIGAIVFVFGDVLVSLVNIQGGNIYNFFTNFLGERGFTVLIVALTAMYHGIALGLGTGIYLKKKGI